MDCRSGEGQLFAKVQVHAGRTAPRWYQEHWESLDRNGTHVQVRFNTTPGTGKFTPVHQGLRNVSVDEIQRELQLLDIYREDRDYNVSGSAHHVPVAAFRSFCQVIEEEWDPPEPESDRGRSCADGAWRAFTFSTAWGVHERETGCIDAPVEVYESSQRIDNAWTGLIREGG